MSRQIDVLFGNAQQAVRRLTPTMVDDLVSTLVGESITNWRGGCETQRLYHTDRFCLTREQLRDYAEICIARQDSAQAWQLDPRKLFRRGNDFVKVG